MSAIPAKTTTAAAPAATTTKAPAAKAATSTKPAPAATAKPAEKTAAPATTTKAAVPDIGDEPQVPVIGEQTVEVDESSETSEAAAPDGESDTDDAAAEEGKEPEPEAPDYTTLGDVPEGVEAYSTPVLDAYKAVASKHGVSLEVAKDILGTMMPAIREDGMNRAKARLAEIIAEQQADLKQRYGGRIDDHTRLQAAGLRALPEDIQEQVKNNEVLRSHPAMHAALELLGARRTNDRPPKRQTPDPAAQAPLSPEAELARQYDEAAKKQG